jgi:hypothetical protein
MTESQQGSSGSKSYGETFRASGAPELISANLIASLKRDKGGTAKVRRISVEVPEHVDTSGLFAAVVRAVQAWEPKDRDGWDVDVYEGLS